MNKLTTLLTVLLTIPLWVGIETTAGAQTPALRVRFIAASPTGQLPGRQKQFKDILPLLKNLRFRSFRAVNDTYTDLKRGAHSDLRYGYRVELTSVRGNAVSVRVRRNRKALLSTRLTLRPGKPVLLGGFPHEDDEKLIIVMTLERRGDDGGGGQGSRGY
mgnify:CR=1 FL=1